jgi:hypothetical protein
MPLPTNWVTGNQFGAADMNLLEAVANNSVPVVTSQALSSTTLVMTIASTPIQIFTGTTQNQVVTLPATAAPDGDQWLLINQGTTATVTCNGSTSGTPIVIAPGAAAILTATSTTPTTAANWVVQYGGIAVTSGKILSVSNSLIFTGTDGNTITFPSGGGTVLVSGGALGTPSSGTLTSCTGLPVAGITPAPATAPAVTTIAEWDANKNLSANNFIEGFATQAASSTTLTLVVGSAQIQVITGTTQTQLIKLPTTSVVAGMSWLIINLSAATVTVQSSGSNTVNGGILAGGTSAVFIAQVATPTTAANWDCVPNTSHTDVVAPLINLAATVIPITTVTSVDSRGGISFPANVRLGTKVRITVVATNSATIQTLTPTLKFGTANTNADTTVLTAALSAGTGAVGSGKFVYEFTVITATTADARVEFYNGNNAATGIAANTSLFTGLSTPATIATSSPTFLGVYFASTVASIVTVRSVAYEVLQ